MLAKLVQKYEYRFHRIFEIFPGLSLWVLLASPFWASFSIPILFGNLLIILAVYWLYKSIIFVIGLILGYRQYTVDQEKNWLEILKALDFSTLPQTSTLPKTKNQLPNHLIVIPLGSAKYETLKPTLQALADQNYPKDQIYISLSFEQRMVEKEPKYFSQMQKSIRKDFGKIFGDRLMIFEHPKDLPGEAIGASGNRTWGNRKAIENLKSKGLDISDFLTTSPDEDLRFHPQYLAAVSYEYSTSDKRKQKFYQTAAYLFNNNYWNVPGLIRVWSISLSYGVLSSSVTHLHDRETWSCYTVALDVMEAVNYWDTSIGIDDTPFFWRPFDYFNGDFECRTFFVPLYADAVYHPSYLTNYHAQFRQLVRWGWGVVAFPIAMKVLTTNTKIPLRLKIRKFYIIFEVVVLFKITALLFSFSAPILEYFSPYFNQSNLAWALPKTLEMIMFWLTVLLLPVLAIKALLMPPKPKEWSTFRHIITYFWEIPLHIFLLFTYAFVPFMIGPTKMMFGKKYDFVVTKKEASK